MPPRIFRSFLITAFLAVPAGFALEGIAATYHVEQRVANADDRNDGSDLNPWKTIARAARFVRAGDVVIIGNGVYRETVTIAQSGTADKPIRFEAAPAATAIITGADRLTQWTKTEDADNVFSTAWNHEFIGWTLTHTHPGDPYHLLIGRCEQVFVGGQSLRQVLDREHLSRGTFYVDLKAHLLYACGAGNQKLTNEDLATEAAARGMLWECKGEWVQTVGLRFRYAANMAQHGAAEFSGSHDLVQDCIFELTNSVGATFLAPDIAVRHCTFKDNGQLGFGTARSHRLAMTDCIISGNNAKGFDRGWEAGGDKLVFTRGAVIEHCTFADNHGCGIWFDIGNEDCTVKNCLIEGNEDAGLFDEISYALHASDNVIIGNGLADTPGAWGAAAGICLSSSPGSVIERNLLIGNKEGFNFREADRSTPRIDGAPGALGEPVWNHDEIVRNNVIAYNRDVQTRGWFDINDERHWPAAMQEKNRADGAPHLSLETLKLGFSNNVYAVRPGQKLFRWGVNWKRNKIYESLEDVQRELILERGSATTTVNVRGFADRDFPLPPEGEKLLRDCFPHGNVPGVNFGSIER